MAIQRLNKTWVDGELWDAVDDANPIGQKIDEVVDQVNLNTNEIVTARNGAVDLNTRINLSETSAATSASNAATSEANALSYLNDFKGRYYGAYSSDPATDPLGNPIDVGDVYYNTTENKLKYWTGSTWYWSTEFEQLQNTVTGTIAVEENIVENGVIVQSVADVSEIDNRISQTQIQLEDTNYKINDVLVKIDGLNSEIKIQASEIQNIVDQNNILSHRVSVAEIDIDGLNSTVTTHASRITTVENDVGALQAEYMLKTDVNGYVAGFGLVNEGATSEFAILANKFKVAMPDGSGTPKQVFTVGTINGQTAVGISGDLIIDGSIVATKIATNAITADKLNVTELSSITANLGNITAGSIGVFSTSNPSGASEIVTTTSAGITTDDGSGGMSTIAIRPNHDITSGYIFTTTVENSQSLILFDCGIQAAQKYPITITKLKTLSIPAPTLVFARDTDGTDKLFFCAGGYYYRINLTQV